MKKKELLKRIEELENTVKTMSSNISSLINLVNDTRSTSISQWQYNNFIKKADEVKDDYKKLWGEIISNHIFTEEQK